MGYVEIAASAMTGKNPDNDQHKMVILKDIAELVMGQSPPGSTYNTDGDGIPFFQGVKDFTSRHPIPRVYCTRPTRFAEPNDILISVRAPIGRVNIADQHCAIGRGLAVVRPHSESDAPFIEYQIKNMAHVWNAIDGGGSVFGNATKQDLLTLPLYWPDEGQRKTISRTARTLDDKVELNHRMGNTLEEIARALFKSWFVDFDPVRAKMQGQWRQGESLPGLPADLHSLFPDGLVGSELGEVPEGWLAGTLGQVIEVNPPRKIRRGKMANHVGMAALPTSGPHVTSWASRAYTSGSRFTLADTLLARITPSLENGKTGFVDFLDSDEIGWGSTEFVVLRSKHPWPPALAYLLARDPGFRDYAISNMTGTSGRQRVPAETLVDYRFAVPPDRVAVAFGKIIQPWFECMTWINRESMTLATLRDTLLPRLISGDVRVEVT